MRIHVYEYTERIFASNLHYRDRKPEYISKFQIRTWRWWLAMALHPISLPCTLALPPPSHRDATTPCLCWAPHFKTQGRLMFSNLTLSELRLSPATMMSNNMPRPSFRPCTAPLSCSLQPLLELSLSCSLQLLLKLSLLSLGPLCSNLSQLFHCCWITETRSLNLCVCFYLFLFCLCFSDTNALHLQVPDDVILIWRLYLPGVEPGISRSSVGITTVTPWRFSSSLMKTFTA